MSKSELNILQTVVSRDPDTQFLRIVHYDDPLAGRR